MQNALKYLDATQDGLMEKLEALKEKERFQTANTEKLVSDLCVAKKEIQEAKKLANEEKSFKLLAENKVQRLKDELEITQTERDTCKIMLEEYKQQSCNLSQELIDVEEKLTGLKVKVKSSERENKDLKQESVQLKEELSDYLTQLHKCRESKLKMKHRVNELEVGIL